MIEQGIQLLMWLESRGHKVVYCACPWAGKCIGELNHRQCGYYWKIRQQVDA